FVYLFIDLLVVLVVDLADNFFEQVLKRDYPLDAAVLIKDESEVKFFLLHLPEHILEPCRVHDINGFLHYPLELEGLWLQQVNKNVFAVDHATHIVHRLAVDRQSRVSMLAKCLHDLFERTVLGDRNDLGPRDHRLFYGGLRKFEYLVDQPPLIFIQQALFLRSIDQLANFLFRIARAVFARGPQPKCPGGFRTGPIQQADRIIKNLIKDLQRDRDKI